MTNLRVMLGSSYNHEAVIINPGVAETNPVDPKTGVELTGSTNIIGVGQTSRQILNRLYGKR